MSTELTSFKHRVDDVIQSFRTVNRYINTIGLSTPRPEEKGIGFFIRLELPSTIEPGVENYDAYARENNEEKPPKVKVVEIFLETLIHDINMFLKKVIASLMCIALKMGHWIRLKIPKMEDGNNIGIMIQETVLGDINGLRNLLLTVEKYQDEYSGSRAEIISAIHNTKRADKWYYKAIQAQIEVIDDDHIHQFQIHIMEIAFELEFVFDKCEKNLEKLMNPKDNVALNSMFE